MKIIILQLISLVFIVSCGNGKNRIKAIENSKAVSITIQKHIPYCGGARPTAEMENNYVLVNDEFILINKTNTTKLKVKSDSLGKIILNLKEGSYAIRETFKEYDFETFYKRETSKLNSYIIDGKKDCYKVWWTKNLIDFTIDQSQDSLILKATITEKCYTGVNPCTEYNGPFPP